MCCGIVKDTLMVRVGPDNDEECLEKNVSVMDFLEKAIKGMVYIAAEGIESDKNLADWVGVCTSFVETLIPKKCK